MIKLEFTFASIDNARNFMAGLGKKSKEAIEAEPTATAEAPPAQSVDLGTAEPQTQVPPVAAALAAPAPEAAPAPAALPEAGAPGNALDSLLTGAPSAAQLPPAPTAPPAAIPPAAPPAAAQPTQQDVIKAFVTLGQNPAKGPTAIKRVLDALGKNTATEVTPDQFATALQYIQQVANEA